EAPGARYARAGDLAADLRRHLSNKPLAGVANRSWAERWQKWRRRRPYAVALTTLGLLVLALTVGLGIFAVQYLGQRRQEAASALEEGRRRLHSHEYADALQLLTRGRALAERFPADHDLARKLDDQLRVTRRAQAAAGLHVLVDQLRFHVGNES